jgi:hypothetical protein
MSFGPSFKELKPGMFSIYPYLGDVDRVLSVGLVPYFHVKYFGGGGEEDFAILRAGRLRDILYDLDRFNKLKDGDRSSLPWDYSRVILALGPLVRHLEGQGDVKALRKIALLMRLTMDLSSQQSVEAQLEFAQEIYNEIVGLDKEISLKGLGGKILGDTRDRLKIILEEGEEVVG